jgi:hypothetical protein
MCGGTPRGEFLQAGIPLFFRRLAALFQLDETVLMPDLELCLGGCGPLALLGNINRCMGRRHLGRRRQARLNGRRHDSIVQILQMNLATRRTPAIYLQVVHLSSPLLIRDVGLRTLTDICLYQCGMHTPYHLVTFARIGPNHAKPIESSVDRGCCPPGFNVGQTQASRSD